MRSFIAVALLLGAATQAVAVDGRVQSACERDYFAYCSQHDPDGEDVRRCMRVNGEKLGDSCVEALMRAGELTPTETARYQQSKRVRR